MSKFKTFDNTLNIMYVNLLKFNNHTEDFSIVTDTDTMRPKQKFKILG